MQPARYVDGADVVAEVPLDLADDGGHREGRELHAAVRVEAVDGVDQPDGADLDDVLHRLVAAAEAGGGVPHERQVGLDQRAAHPGVLRGARLEVLELAEEHLGERPGVRAPGLRFSRRPAGRPAARSGVAPEAQYWPARSRHPFAVNYGQLIRQKRS